MNIIKELVQKSKGAETYQISLSYLEEAHVISQPNAITHFYVHYEMFLLAWKHKETKEIIGQIPRIILAIPGSLLGLAPKGNLGSTKMGIFEEKK